MALDAGKGHAYGARAEVTPRPESGQLEGTATAAVLPMPSDEGEDHGAGAEAAPRPVTESGQLEGETIAREPRRAAVDVRASATSSSGPAQPTAAATTRAHPPGGDAATRTVSTGSREGRDEGEGAAAAAVGEVARRHIVVLCCKVQLSPTLQLEDVGTMPGPEHCTSRIKETPPPHNGKHTHARSKCQGSRRARS